MGRKIFVGNLSYDATLDDVREAFAKIGPLVDVALPAGTNGAANRGFAFVTFEHADDADRAIKEMTGVEIRGRAIRLDYANEKQERGDRNREGRDHARPGARRWD
jgi:nucleolin